MSNLLDVLDTDYGKYDGLVASVAIMGLSYGLKHTPVPNRLRALIASAVVTVAWAAAQVAFDVDEFI